MKSIMNKGQTEHLVSSADCKPVASGCVGSTPTLSTKFEKGEKIMATEWKKPIEKVKSLYSEIELLTMSFKEYWALGLTPTWSPVRSK